MANVRSLLREVFGPLLSLTMMTLILPDNNSLLSVDSLGVQERLQRYLSPAPFFFLTQFCLCLFVVIVPYYTILDDTIRCDSIEYYNTMLYCDAIESITV